jgi:putative DNA primase/helicase
MTAAEIARRLHGRKSGDGYVARCPAHDDRNPSLSLRVINGKLLVHCHAGCDQRAVITALDELGLWPKNQETQRLIVKKYAYRDDGGRLLYRVVRTEPKGFFQQRPDSRGGWINKKGEPQVLYRVREVIRTQRVFVVEGEKDADRLRDNGFVATTNAGGAKAPWLPQYTEALRGREVILIPDNDLPGRQRLVTIARALLGYASRIIVLELSDGKDVSDWFDRGHSEVELVHLIEKEETKR